MFARRGSLPTVYNTVFEDDEEGSSQDSPVGSCHEPGKTLPGTISDSYRKYINSSSNCDKQSAIRKEASHRSCSPSGVSRPQHVSVSSVKNSEYQSENMYNQKPQVRLRKRSRSHEDVVISVQPTPKVIPNNCGVKSVVNENFVTHKFSPTQSNLASSTSNLVKPLDNPEVPMTNSRLVNRRATWCINAAETNTVAIDDKIEQAMDLVKSHLIFAVREEVKLMKEKISQLVKRIKHLEMENEILRIYATPDTLSLLPDTRISGMGITNNYSSGISGWRVPNASRGKSMESAWNGR
ncbi:TSC22 domain family protein 2-like [Ctenocephalides felis]|uniref:TSC22 domain family protein 2-like n=1 Tax=Ctenocephalides felis TaxID=7515 RepID=UPI000E6E27AF|nr:TSC22 domain family protein 2-like [Ctenocephalides felis]